MEVKDIRHWMIVVFVIHNGIERMQGLPVRVHLLPTPCLAWMQYTVWVSLHINGGLRTIWNLMVVPDQVLDPLSTIL